MNKIFVFLILLFFMASVRAESELHVALVPEQLATSTTLGVIEIDGAGPVSLTAQKNGNQVVIHAAGPDGSVIGKAESVVGLRDTPIYVMTSNGLEKITIYWGVE